ncbi:Cof-type HAD-IIB family hydrolase [Aeromonas diversa]|uniref:Cof-type HAD-IIB family hydrolase n=1 Tax=Aeromonas diversa TaxID=502790 RepID=UPI003462C59C
MYKVVVSDLDGTLLNSAHQISARTRATLHNLVQQGVKFVMATGRHYVDVRHIRDTLGLDIYLITSNGAVVHDKQDQLVFNQTIAADIARELVTLERDSDIHLNVYYGEEWLVEAEMPWLLQFHHESGFSYRKVDLASHPLDRVNKVFYIGEHEKLVEIERGLKARYGQLLHVTFSLPDCLEVMHGEVNKGSAVKAVLEQNGLSLEQAIAFGDGMNDFEMLSMVGHGVVMGNAHDRLINALPHHQRTLTSDEDGVAHYLERCFAR